MNGDVEILIFMKERVISFCSKETATEPLKQLLKGEYAKRRPTARTRSMNDEDRFNKTTVILMQLSETHFDVIYRHYFSIVKFPSRERCCLCKLYYIIFLFYNSGYSMSFSIYKTFTIT